ncbi:hypothetical protein LCGC14_2687750 [marine sediment metagenome]|uniref:Uncharacterized protein n=1 Tax=marine sediment metagenome TaxID=412755 RepID=A0A0F9CB73_9ZZZZ
MDQTQSTKPLEYDPLLEFLWRNNGSLNDFDEAVRKINKSALKVKIKKAATHFLASMEVK